MIPQHDIKEQLAHTLDSIEIDGLGDKIEGKVRDCYVVGDRRILITSDRLSAFDVVLTSIPFKGQILTQMAMYWFEQTKHIIPNHILSHPHPNVMITKEVQILPIEVVVRGYLAGSGWRDYSAGKAISGVELPNGMKKSQKLDSPILTPSTKAERGEHDEPISEAELLKRSLVDENIWQQVRSKALELFDYGTQKAKEHGLILVDTKYEFGLLKTEDGDTQVILADEVHTPDSSRYWILESYQEQFEKGEDPEMLDKEFVRRALIEKGYMGDGTPPEFTDEFRIATSMRYMQAFENVTGREFIAEVGCPKEDIIAAVRDEIKS